MEHVLLLYHGFVEYNTPHAGCVACLCLSISTFPIAAHPGLSMFFNTREKNRESLVDFVMTYLLQTVAGMVADTSSLHHQKVKAKVYWSPNVC